MGKKNTAEFDEYEWGTDNTWSYDELRSDRRLVLVREPPSRKVQLMEAGVREIRCVSCVKIKPIAQAEEYGDRWICTDCLSHVVSA